MSNIAYRVIVYRVIVYRNRVESSLTLNDIAALLPKSLVSGRGEAAVMGLSRDSRQVRPG